MSGTSVENQLAQDVRRLVPREALVPHLRVYFVDFGITIVVAHLATLTTQSLLQSQRSNITWVLAGAAFFVSVVASFRALMFIHELAHRSEPSFRRFRMTWNGLAGIPFLVPSFFYDTHLEHHRATTYGTAADGEYLPSALRSRFGVALFLMSGLMVPFLMFTRFAILGPLSFLFPRLRRLVWQRASALIVNAKWERPWSDNSWDTGVVIQEFACSIWCVVLMAIPQVLGLNLALWAAHLICLGAALATLNMFRTLAAHRWTGDGNMLSFEGQTLDSVNIESDRLWEILVNPVGLRFHALHHLLPAAPYHALPTLHRQLRTALPKESAYRRLGVSSVRVAIQHLWQTAATSQTSNRACDDRSSGVAESP